MGETNSCGLMVKTCLEVSVPMIFLFLHQILMPTTFSRHSSGDLGVLVLKVMYVYVCKNYLRN